MLAAIGIWPEISGCGPGFKLQVATPWKGFMLLKALKRKQPAMKRKKLTMHARHRSYARKSTEQPAPFTPGITRAMVRQYAYELYRDKLPHDPLSLEDWVLAEKDLAQSLEADDVLAR
jgi:hypothetical protein